MHPFSKLWAILFLPLTLIYSVVSAIKNYLYDSKILTPKKVNVPVISIGNLTVGGTGKTPIVAFIANELSERGYKVGIVSRGYGRKSKGTVWVAKEGQLLTVALNGGDEPVELASTVKNITIVVGDSRYEAATELLSKVVVDFILVDDGMQHRKFQRDLEIVVQDVKSASGWKFQLPSGVFRESWKNIKRADIVLWTKWDHPAPTEKFTDWKTFPDQLHLWTEFVPKEFYSVQEKKTVGLKEMVEKTAVVFCGIGQPERFRSDLEKLGIRILEFKVFGDHYEYSEQDLEGIFKSYKLLNAQVILTTAKDFHRLKVSEIKNDFPLFYLKGEVKVESGMEKLMESLVGLKANNFPVNHEILSMIKNKMGNYSFSITQNTKLEHDLGMTGDDAYEFLIEFSQKFNVDVSNFQIDKYFLPEGDSLLPTISRLIRGEENPKQKELTIGDLENSILKGKLDETTIGKANHENW